MKTTTTMTPEVQNTINHHVITLAGRHSAAMDSYSAAVRAYSAAVVNYQISALSASERDAALDSLRLTCEVTSATERETYGAWRAITILARELETVS